MVVRNPFIVSPRMVRHEMSKDTILKGVSQFRSNEELFFSPTESNYQNFFLEEPKVNIYNT